MPGCVSSINTGVWVGAQTILMVMCPLSLVQSGNLFLSPLLLEMATLARWPRDYHLNDSWNISSPLRVSCTGHRSTIVGTAARVRQVMDSINCTDLQ